MKYRKLIEEFFLIDEPKTGELVPFIFNKVQDKYYREVLVGEYDIENKGIAVAARENILKARREGFSSLILALFAADDIGNENPTETVVISYRDDATKTFRKRYRNFVLSFYARKKMGLSVERIKKEPGLLDQAAKQFLSTDSTDIEHAHNRAHFYCGTASARVGGRGGVLQKILYSEIAYYPDSENMTAKEIIEGTMRQVDIASGWIFCESTENGRSTYQYKMWTNVKQGLSRFRNRFYGAKEFYTDEEIAQIRAEFVDMDMFRREYPMTEQDLFASSSLSFVTEDDVNALVMNEKAKREIVLWVSMKGTNYIDQCEILFGALEGIEKKYPKNALYAGIDIAKQHDRTVLTVLKDRSYAMKGGVKCISIDSTGQGDFMPDWFERNSRWYLERVKFSRQTKDLMYTNLTAVIKKQYTSIPLLVEDGKYVSEEAEAFWNEMVELEKKIIGEMIVVSHPNTDGGHDDFPDSWALAENSFVVINGVDVRKKAEASTTVADHLGKMLDRGSNPHSPMIDDEYS